MNAETIDCTTSFKKYFRHLGDKHNIKVYSSVDTHIPLDLCFVGSITGNTSLKEFWGLKYSIVYTLINPYNKKYQLIKKNFEKSSFKLISAFNNHLPSTAAEIDFFNNIVNHRLDFTDLSAYFTRDRRLKVIWRLNHDIDFIHVSCHGINANRDRYLEFNSNVRVDPPLLSGITNKANIHPIITINACQSGGCTEFDSASFAEALLSKLAHACVICTITINDDFAKDFTIKLYEYINNNVGQKLADIVLAVKKELFELDYLKGISVLSYLVYTVDPDVIIGIDPVEETNESI